LLKDPEQRETALKLSYEVISSNTINATEAKVYQQLVELVALPPEVVQRVEQDVKAGTLR
jgi:urea transport system ATP-binding protein